MPILVWTGEDLPNDLAKLGLHRVLIEVKADGTITREIGLTADDRVLYIAPAKRGKYRYGTFDLQVIDVSSVRDEFSQTRFDELWTSAAPQFEPRTDRTISGKYPR